MSILIWFSEGQEVLLSLVLSQVLSLAVDKENVLFLFLAPLKTRKGVCFSLFVKSWQFWLGLVCFSAGGMDTTSSICGVYWYLWAPWSLAAQQWDQQQAATKSGRRLQNMLFCVQKSPPVHPEPLTCVCCIASDLPGVTGNDVIASYLQCYFKML